MKSLSNSDLIQIGFVSKPSGFNGEVLIAVDDYDPADFSETRFFFIRIDGKPVPFLIEHIKSAGSALIVKLEDVNTEAEAKTLNGKKILVEKSEVRENEDELNWADLVGYELFDRAYGSLGKLESIEEYPQQVIAKCTVKEKEVLIPLHEDLISKIDDVKKEVHLDLPEGLLDVYLS